MADLKEKSIALLESTASVNLNSVATTNLYTVPTGKIGLVTHVVFHHLSGDTTNCECSFGQTGAKTDWQGIIALGDYLDTANADWGIVRNNLDYLEASTTWDPGSIADGDEEVKSVTVAGAELGDFARASFSLNQQDLALTAFVQSANTVYAQLNNNTGGSIDLGSGTLRVRVDKVKRAPRNGIEYTAGEIFCIDVTTAAGVACTATVDVFGYLVDA